MKLTFYNNETNYTTGIPQEPLDTRTKTETAINHRLNLFMLIPPCFTRCAQFTAVLEAMYFKSEYSETNLSYIPSYPFFIVLTPMTPAREEMRKTNSV